MSLEPLPDSAPLRILGAMPKPPAKPKKNPAAVALGRKGGQAYAKLPKKERQAAARKAARARWDGHPKKAEKPALAERSAL
jgi:hypothetical protein